MCAPALDFDRRFYEWDKNRFRKTKTYCDHWDATSTDRTEKNTASIALEVILTIVAVRYRIHIAMQILLFSRCYSFYLFWCCCWWCCVAQYSCVAPFLCRPFGVVCGKRHEWKPNAVSRWHTIHKNVFTLAAIFIAALYWWHFILTIELIHFYSLYFYYHRRRSLCHRRRRTRIKPQHS